MNIIQVQDELSNLPYSDRRVQVNRTLRQFTEEMRADLDRLPDLSPDEMMDLIAELRARCIPTATTRDIGQAIS